MIIVIIGIILSLFSYIAVELSFFVKEMENGCMSCDGADTCQAWKKTLITKDNFVDEWMLITYLLVRKKCYKVKQCIYKQKLLCFLFCFCIYIIPFWSKGFTFYNCLYGITGAALFFLSIVDWNTQYIPLEMSGIILICGLIHLFMNVSNWLEYVIGLIAVSGFLLLVNWMATPILRKRYEGELELDSVIGDGDIKLMAATGLLLGWKLNFLALGIGCIAGSVIHLILMKIKGSERQFALGPYLSLGVYITMICGEQLISWYLNVMGVTPY